MPTPLRRSDTETQRVNKFLDRKSSMDITLCPLTNIPKETIDTLI
jgi:hypothetical protein